MLHNLDETLQNVWSVVHFYRFFIEQLGQGASKSSLLREIATPLSSCVKYLKEITQRLHPLFHLSIKFIFFEKIIIS
jgi:hypothetical protein